MKTTTSTVSMITSVRSRSRPIHRVDSCCLVAPYRIVLPVRLLLSFLAGVVVVVHQTDEPVKQSAEQQRETTRISVTSKQAKHDIEPIDVNSIEHHQASPTNINNGYRQQSLYHCQERQRTELPIEAAKRTTTAGSKRQGKSGDCTKSVCVRE